MKPALLDVNVLLALGWPTHQHHEAAHRWFHRESRYGWATCALTQLGFVRLSSNPAYTPDAVSPLTAATLLDRLTAHRRHRFWPTLPAVAPAALHHAVGHQQVMDAYLVAVAQTHEGRLVSLDAGVTAHAARDVTIIDP